MADTEEGTKTLAATELKYVHLDYSQYKIKEPEVQDIYFGIEKGDYEFQYLHTVSFKIMSYPNKLCIKKYLTGMD